jgi:hypothetical protein
MYVPFLNFAKAPEGCENDKQPVENQEDFRWLF